MSIVSIKSLGRNGVILLVNFLLSIGVVKGWSSKVTEASCKSLFPVHGATPQDIPSPYVLIVNKTEMFSNETVLVSLEGDWLKGFLVVAKPTGTWQNRWQHPIGLWRNGYGLHTINCFEAKHSAVSHGHSQYYDSVELEWLPPRDFEGRVTFIAVVVKRFREFWMSVTSSSVKVIKS